MTTKSIQVLLGVIAFGVMLLSAWLAYFYPEYIDIAKENLFISLASFIAILLSLEFLRRQMQKEPKKIIDLLGMSIRNQFRLFREMYSPKSFLLYFSLTIVFLLPFGLIRFMTVGF